MGVFQSIEFVHLNLGSNGCLADKWNTHVQYSFRYENLRTIVNLSNKTLITCIVVQELLDRSPLHLIADDSVHTNHKRCCLP